MGAGTSGQVCDAWGKEAGSKGARASGQVCDACGKGAGSVGAGASDAWRPYNVNETRDCCCLMS